MRRFQLCDVRQSSKVFWGENNSGTATVPGYRKNFRSTLKRYYTKGHRMRAPKDPTAGLSNEAAVEAIGNRYNLVLVAARRVRELHRGDAIRIEENRHGAVVTTLMEIEQGKVGLDYLLKDSHVELKRQRRATRTFN
jgi:DNA-directed RNA polymerase omega subunit